MLGVLQFLAVLGIAGFFAFKSYKTTTTKREGFRDVTERSISIPTLAIGAVVSIVAAVLLSSFGTIGAGERGVVLRFGGVTGRTLSSGLYYVTPVIESVHKMDIRTNVENAKASAASKDMQSVATNVALNFSLRPESLTRLYAQIGDSYRERIITPAVQEAVKSTTAKFNAEDLITKRQEVKDLLTQELTTRLDTIGIHVDAVSITDFAFSADFTNAIEQKQVSTQEALKAQNDLKKVQFEADQRVAQATAEAEAIRIQAQAIQSQGGAGYVQMKAIEKWDGALPVNMYGSAPVPFINIQK